MENDRLFEPDSPEMPKTALDIKNDDVQKVGVGYHHPPTQWLYTPMGARQGGNSAAVAYTAPARLASWNFCFLGVSVAGDSMHDEFVLLHIGHLCTLALC